MPSARQLRSERLATGVAGVTAAIRALSQTTAVPRVSLVGQISKPDPFQDGNYYFPDDLKTIDHWIEFTAKETKGNETITKGIRLFTGLIGTQVTGATIRLPMPAGVSTDYNPQYSSPDLNVAAGQLIKPFDQQIYNNNSMPGLLNGAGLAGVLGGGALESGAGTALGSATGILLDKGSKSDVFNAVAKVGAGVSVNPHKIILFTGVDFREHRFTWKLSPRNRDESNRIRDIINVFTRYAHPEFVGGGMFFKYPEFFEIKFRHPEYLFKMQPSVCTDIQVNYHGQGFPAYIRDANGGGDPAPAEVELTLAFKETEIVTKNYLDGRINEARNGRQPTPEEAEVARRAQQEADRLLGAPPAAHM
jgi:hypothetical protein